MIQRIRVFGLLGTALTLVLAWGIRPVAAPESSNMQSSSLLRLTAGERRITAAESDLFFRESATSPYPERGGIIQFDRLPDSTTRAWLSAQGVQLHGYLPDRAFLATVPSSIRLIDLSWAGIRWVSSLRPEEKLAEILQI